MHRFVACLQNHDQIGNRPRGDRLNHSIAPESWRAASVLLLTAPMTPLLFMGQEWAASTPFQFFTDLEPELGSLVTDGRRREFSNFRNSHMKTIAPPFRTRRRSRRSQPVAFDGKNARPRHIVTASTCIAR